ncbi:intraflagellar transport-associated protein isoform X2 [Astyanax mexicanus]|uniref:intraflagellar transport-associated protein isoform X2 n=1 Tax=Astyanax mexicanus TaxID=7994 RepID=UPI0020CB42F4|nr:intraflagellar transport-associated protein isoform X2 [Astyanax mexicanus]XP_049330614.1 intraflagellar transport-associated protein isoform X2 [Astyanax mexicanus]
MPGLQSNSEAASHDRAMIEALEQFCNSTEQSYEEFLSTFTQLTTENVIRGLLNVNRGDSSSCLGQMNRRDGESTDRRLDGVDESESSPRGQQSQRALTADLEEFDNYLDDMEPEEDPVNADPDVCVLPGEVEEDLPAYTPSFCHCTLLEISSTATDHRTHSPQTIATQCQNQTEEVVPFALDDTFDYDSVVLSQKQPIQNSFRGTS